MMENLLFPLDQFRSDPEGFLWIFVMGFLIACSCGWVGTYLILRRSALIGDAISHSLLPGIVIAFIVTGSRSSLGMMVGALIAGLLTTVAIDLLSRKTRLKEDAAIGIVFSFFFAVGVILVSMFASSVDLDLDCVLFGEIGFVSLAPYWEWGGVPVAPEPVAIAAGTLLLVLALLILFYKELLLTSFDPTFSGTVGVNPVLTHYLLVVVLTITVVAAFDSVGAVLVVAMLIVPGSTAYLFFDRLIHLLLAVPVLGVLTSAGGLYLSLLLNCSTAGAMVIAGFLLFLLAWFFAPQRGLVAQWRRRGQRLVLEEPEAESVPAEI